MGLHNKQPSNTTIVTIVGGKFTIRLPEGEQHPEATERILEKGPNAGTAVLELRYNTLDGKIVGGEMHTSDFGTDFVLVLEDDGELFKLQIPLESQYFGQVAKRLPNLDITKNTVFGLGFDKERQRNFLFIQQDGTSIHMAYTKDNPNGMPPPIRKTVKGQEKWDFEEQENFLYEVAIDFLDQLDSTSYAKDESPSAAYTDNDAPAEPEPPEAHDEEVPF